MNFNTYEQEIDYLIDKVENPLNEKTWTDMVDDLSLSVHPDVLRKSFTGGRYGGYQIAKYYKHKMEENYSSEELERLQNIKDELYKERCKLSDLQRERNKILREEARFELLLDVLKQQMSLLPEINITSYRPKTALTLNNKKIGVLQFSDWHIGKVIDNQWNSFNNDIATQRVNKIVDKTISYSTVHKVTDLIIEINGDMIEGIIQVSSRNATEADAISSITFVSELLCQAINSLKPYYNSIKIVTTLGNHGRLFADKKACLTKENFEMLIPEFIKLRLGEDIPIIKSYGLDFTAYEIDGRLICLAHGQNDRLATVISDFSKIYKRVPSEIHLGHTHEYKDISDCDIYVTVNGCLDGADDYAISLRKVSKPSQNFIVYDEDRCIYNLSAE